MIIDYNNNNPPLPGSPETGVLNWILVKEIAKNIGDWYARGASVIPLNQRIINMYFFYCWLKYSGYAHYAARALAAAVWLESGFDGSQWGTGRVRSDTPYGNFEGHVDPAHPDPDDPQHFDYYFGFQKIYASNWETLPASAPPNLVIFEADQMTNPTIMSLPSYGLVQWTPYTAVRGHSDAYGQEVGENWFNAYLNNSSLQCFILDWEQSIADSTPTGQQYGSGYMGEWINDRHTGEQDIVTLTWQQWKDDSYLEGVPLLDDMKFLNSMHQFYVHYVHATPEDANDPQKDAARLVAKHMYIDNAFSAWDNAGGGDIFDMPEPIGTLLDPWHTSLYPLLAKFKRRAKSVRTILL